MGYRGIPSRGIFGADDSCREAIGEFARLIQQQMTLPLMMSLDSFSNTWAVSL